MRVRRQLFLALTVGLALAAGGLLSWKLRPAYRHWAASRIKPIDDFNDGTESNLIGGEPFTQAPAEATLNPALLRVHTPTPGELALALTYNLPIHASAAWGTGLNDLDISAAHSLRFWIKTDQLPLPELRIELVDGFGQSAQAALPRLHSTTQWQRIVIPAKSFPGVNFNRLDRFALHMSAPTQALEGRLYLDEVAFESTP